MKVVENWSDMLIGRGSSNYTGSWILDQLKFMKKFMG